ncbi:unnamed protein product [Eruca vesicaria subsp. sativa]|uniref:BHLH domain-containing protein n=1 Tax=Eruca vesicaria subsp. sativa TaxID=29727 RepID=A0ABC8LPE3_ERUVS|nr:unnamed protein product [Eruca vesicaria subsp. sativa]
MVKHEAGPDQVMPPPKFRLTDPSSGVKEQYLVMTVGPSHCGSNQSHNNLDVSVSHDRSKTIDERLYLNASSSSRGSSGYSFGKTIKEMLGVEALQQTAIGNKLNQQPGSTRRSHAADVHNLSERRRRDRINETMKALQDLIPHCSKTDKASILDEAIDYMKSLKLQLQVMRMRSGMVASVAPMMFPGVQSHPFIHQMQSPVQLPRFPVMNNLSLACQNPVQHQVFSDRFDRYIGILPQTQALSFFDQTLCKQFTRVLYDMVYPSTNVVD